MIDRFNMISMDGIDLAEVNGNKVDGLFEKISESVSNCRFQILYNWKFAGILIPPTTVEISIEDDVAVINEFISITSSDVVTIASLIIEPVIESLLCTSNGVYNVEPPASGFNPVTVNVESEEPVIESLLCTSNGVYNVEPPASGFNPVTVNVESEETLAFIRVNYPEGTRCVIYNGDIEYDAPDTSGEWVFSAKSLGEYRVECYISSTPASRVISVQYGKEYEVLFNRYVTIDDILSSIGAASVNVVDGTVSVTNAKTFTVVVIDKTITSIEFDISRSPNFITYVSDDGSYCYGYDQQLSGFRFNKGTDSYTATGSSVPQRTGSNKSSGHASAIIENEVMTITWEDSSTLVLSPANCFGWWASGNVNVNLWINATKN